MVDKVFFLLVKVIVFCIYCLLFVLEVPMRAGKKTRKFFRSQVMQPQDEGWNVGV